MATFEDLRREAMANRREASQVMAALEDAFDEQEAAYANGDASEIDQAVSRCNDLAQQLDELNRRGREIAMQAIAARDDGGGQFGTSSNPHAVSGRKASAVRLITTQSFRDPATVTDKQTAGDYVVLVTPEFMLNGEPARAVLDGHHSLQAAINDGVDPVLIECCTGDAGGRCNPVLDARTCEALGAVGDTARVEEKGIGPYEAVRDWVQEGGGDLLIDSMTDEQIADRIIPQYAMDPHSRPEVIYAVQTYREQMVEDDAANDNDDEEKAARPGLKRKRGALPRIVRQAKSAHELYR